MSNQEKAEEVARRILAALEEAGKSILALSVETGIASSTLHRNLTKTPQKLTLEHLILIALALDLDFDLVLVSKKVAA